MFAACKRAVYALHALAKEPEREGAAYVFSLQKRFLSATASLSSPASLVAAADARLAELDAVCADKAAVWARPDAEDVVSAALGWFSWPTVWAQPVEDDAEAARLLRVADNAEAPAVELWRQLHNYRFPFCSGGAACAVHRETPVCGFVDPRAAAQAQSWEATPPPPPPPPPTPEQPAGRVSPERPGATSPPLAALQL